ncbi:MAG: acetate--CoA ligase [Gemmatimonadales bacterium]|nr:MAG: acetate--CoA ligase [Gemmatimonadales bacterium]
MDAVTPPQEPEAFWSDARASLAGLPDGRGLNMAHEAVDRHLSGPAADRVAFRFLPKKGEPLEMTYRELAAESNRFARLLERLQVGPGSTVFLLLGRVPHLYVAVLGALKARCVVCPLFSAFGPEPIRSRMAAGDARVLVTTPTFYRRKVAGLREALPGLDHVLLAGPPEETTDPGVHCLADLLAREDAHYRIPDTDPQDPALLHFTSGTTGVPKGALHVHEAVVAHHVTGRSALDLRPDDRFWCTADPGWVTGMSYGIVSPLTSGVTSIVDEREFDAEGWYRTLQDERVTVWYTAPTAIRMLMKAGRELPRRFDLSSLRFIASVGEPLNPEAVVWSQEVLGLPIHDNWWQTETGGIMIANIPGQEIRPGSMGRPLPGVEAAVGRRTNGEVEVIREPDEEGELLLRTGWPSLFRTYLGQEERYRGCFQGDWYLTGDLVRRDADGYFWFVGRADDVIKSAGHLIGPFEVESALLEHPAVAEAAVIGKPDPMVGEMVKAFVALHPGYTPDEDLRLQIVGHARKRLGSVAAPKELEILDDLPKTKSGKTLRRLLKARELGLPEGDVSTLESPS